MTPPGLRWHVTVLNAKLTVHTGRQVRSSWTGNGQAQCDLASWPLPTKWGWVLGSQRQLRVGTQVVPEVLGPKISLKK